MTGSGVETIRRFLEDAWPSRDADAILEHFTEDAVFHNMPHGPWTGRAEISDALHRLCAQVDAFAFKIRRIGGDDDVVFAERVDTCVVGSTVVDIPVHGVFEMRDGRISSWRDYFDGAVVAPLYAALETRARAGTA